MSLFSRKRYKTYLDHSSSNSSVPKRTANRYKECGATTSDFNLDSQDASFSSEPIEESIRSILGTSDLSEEFSFSEDESETECSMDDDENFLGDSDLFKKIFSGLKITRFEVLLLLLHFSLRHGLSGIAIVDLIKLFNVIFENEVIPPSLYLFKKVFSSKIVPATYCVNCKSYLGNDNKCKNLSTCVSCNHPLNKNYFFITIPMTGQIKCVLEEPGCFEAINRHKKNIPLDSEQDSEILYDLRSGERYKELKRKGVLSDRDLTITFNCDGSPIFKSVKNSLWPIHFRINELPLKERFQSYRTMVAGLWFGNQEPVMATFLTPFILEANELHQNGINFFSDGIQENIKILLTSCVADSIAKAAIQNVKQFNGRYGCPYCYHPGSLVGSQIKYKAEMFCDRTDKEMRKDMETAEVLGKEKRGVKGLSSLYVLPYFDIVNGFQIDYMHCCLLGVTKLLANLWTSSSNHLSNYYLDKKKVNVINIRLLNIKVPRSISRRPRPFSDMVHWKANEWRNWLLFYSAPCLKYVLPLKYFRHYNYLLSAVYILLQSSVSKSEIDIANCYLTNFVFEFELLYGEVNMNFNVHLLLHPSKCVSIWGPLWLYSAFPFESGNGHLVKLVKGTKGILKQIAHKYCIYLNIPAIINKYQNVNIEVLEYCDLIMSYKRLKKSEVCGGSTILGKPQPFRPTLEEKQILCENYMNILDKLFSVKKIIINGVMYHVKEYGNKKCDDSVVQLYDGSYVIIQSFF